MGKLKNECTTEEYEKITFCRKRWAENHPNFQREYYQKNKEYLKSCRRKNHRDTREEIIALLGGKCSNPFNLPHPDWCNDWRCLQIDHVKGDGHKERILVSKGRGFWLFILKKIKSGSKDYQLLCANCNWIKRVEKGEEN